MNRYIDSELITLEDRLADATRSVNIDELNALYANDIIFTGVTGAVCDKTSLMDEATRGLAERLAARATPDAASVVSYEKDDLRGVRHDDTAVCSYRFGVTIRANGQEVTRKYRTTNVWMKRGESWQVVAAHTAMLG